MERIFKNGYIHMFDPRVIKSIVKMHTRYRRNNLIMLCASAYAPIDISLFFAYPNKMLKWGYFPEIIEYNIKKLLELLGNPQNNLKIIHVAGTNGKGSTCSFISTILKQSGYKVGLYTSPFLETFTERIRVNGENIPENLK